MRIGNRSETESLLGRLGSNIVLFRCKEEIKESRLVRTEAVQDEDVLELAASTSPRSLLQGLIRQPKAGVQD